MFHRNSIPIIVVLVCLGASLRCYKTQSPQTGRGLFRSWSEPALNGNQTNNRFNYNQQQRRPSAQSYRDSCKTNYKFDYVQLSLQWSPGMCSTSSKECKREESRHFTVHGMWPTIRGTEEPSNCCFDNTFDYRALDSLLPLLNEYWFSYYDSGDSRRFWAHEWLKHGTCARDIPELRGEKRYFGTTVQIAKQMPIMETLKAAQIVPDDSKVYQTSDITRALLPITKGKVYQVDCDFEHHQPIPVLKGLNFCFDSDLKPSDCPEMKRRCSRQVIMPKSSKRQVFKL